MGVMCQCFPEEEPLSGGLIVTQETDRRSLLQMERAEGWGPAKGDSVTARGTEDNLE